VFDLVTVDTGYWPSQSDPISARFHITPSGGVTTEFEAESLLEWPSALEQGIRGTPGTGHLEVEAELELEAEVYINLFGIFVGSVPLWTENLRLDGETEFEPLIEPEVVVDLTDPVVVDPFEVPITIITGVDLVFSVGVYPELVETFSPVRVETETGDAQVLQAQPGVPVTIPIGDNQPAEILLTSTVVAEYDTKLDVVLEPAASLDVILLGSFELIDIPLAVPLVSEVVNRTIGPEVYAHALPALRQPDAEVDFGSVEIGAVSNVELPLENIGAMGLEGTLVVNGDSAFSVFPKDFYALPGQVDGAVLTFAPQRPGDYEATLFVTSSDPSVPQVEVVVRGSSGKGLVEEDAFSASLTTCGCASATGNFGWLWLSAVAALARRRFG